VELERERWSLVELVFRILQANEKKAYLKEGNMHNYNMES